MAAIDSQLTIRPLSIDVQITFEKLWQLCLSRYLQKLQILMESSLGRERHSQLSRATAPVVHGFEKSLCARLVNVRSVWQMCYVITGGTRPIFKAKVR